MTRINKGYQFIYLSFLIVIDNIYKKISEQSLAKNLPDPRRIRAVINMQLGKINMKSFNTVWHLINIQIETEEELENEIECRVVMNDRYFEMMDWLQESWGQLHAGTQMDLEHITTQPTQGFQAPTPLMSFIPLQ